MKSNSYVEKLENTWRLLAYFSINCIISTFIYKYFLGFGFLDAVANLFDNSHEGDELGRLGLGPTMDLFSLLNFWTFLQLPVLSMALVLTRKNPHGVCAAAFQLPFILLMFFHISTAFYITLSHIGSVFFNTGQSFQGSVNNIGTVLIIETWLLMPSLILLLDKLGKRRN